MVAVSGKLSREDKARAAELLEEKLRRNAHRDLLSYAQYMIPNYRVNHHHEKIAQALMDCEAGLIDRLMITTPPRHGKSLLASVIFPGWYMGRNPGNEVIAAAYGKELISGFGRRLRNMVRDERQSDIFGPEAALSPESRARDMWLTNAGGVYRASGVGGGITGFGAHAGIIDDPVKSIEEADSPTVQRANWLWYQTDFYSRIMKGGFIVVIQTRWHEEDLAGKLLEAEEEGGDVWHKVHFPAINEKGEALWPDEYPVKHFDRIRALPDMTARMFNALYQGNPLPEEGNLFQDSWFKTYAKMPDTGRMRIYGASDYAVTYGGGDYTVHVVVGVDADDHIWVLDFWRAQESSDVSVDAQLMLMDKWKTLIWAEESGQILKSIGPFLQKRQRELKAWGYRKQFSSASDKAQRAQSFVAAMASGRVSWPGSAPWYPALKSEFLKFPLGKNDDQVDAFSLVGRLISSMASGEKRPGPEGQMAAIRVGDGELPKGLRDYTFGEVAEDTMRRSRERRRQMHYA